MKRYCTIVLMALPLFAAENSLHIKGVQTTYKDANGQQQSITVKREIDTSCNKIPITNEIFWENGYAHQMISDNCKSTFITSAGKNIFPMSIHPKIETVAELEVLEFIESMQSDQNMLLIDTRGEEWYDYRTIPGAINIHYLYIMEHESFEKEYRYALSKIGIMHKNGALDFSKAKELMLFCNGAWCSQSPKMIKALLKLGYPPEKLKWYRGGMEDWLGLSMTTTRK